MTAPALFQPFTLRGVTLKNRIGVSPMCMYSSEDGFATDFHLVHLGRFALGGAGLVIMEATAIDPAGRISPFDAGIWSDEHIPGLARVASFVEASGAVAGIQLGHAGRRASVREPWFAGAPLGDDATELGYPQGSPWATRAPSALPAGPEFPTPAEMTADEVRDSIEAWATAAKRAVTAGFRFIELHGAHGYLLHSFLSPLSNTRTDEFGGSVEGRRKYPLDVARAIRAAVGDDIVLSYRVSSVDGFTGGLELADTVEFARDLKAAGIDIVDTSSGGITTDRSMDTRVRRGFAFHADFSRAVREDADIPSATVGLITDPQQAEFLVSEGDADIVLLGREMLNNPNWAHHALATLADSHDEWDVRYGSAIAPRAGTLARLTASGETPLSRFSE